MNKIACVGVVGLVFAGLSAGAAEETFEWQPSERKAAYGAAAVSYAETTDDVTGVTVTGTSADDPATVVLTGEEPFGFAPDAAVQLLNGELRLETPVSGGGISVENAAEGPATLTAKGGLYTVESATVGSKAKLVLEGLADGSTLTNFTLGASDAALEVRNMGTAALTGDFSATEGGRLSFGVNWQPEPIVNVSTNIATPLSGAKARKLLSPLRLADVLSYSVPVLENSCTKKPLMCYVVTNSPTHITFQLQADDGSWTKGSVIELYESSQSVYIRMQFAAYWSASKGKAGTIDMLGEGFDSTFYTAKWIDTNNYRPASIDLVYRTDPNLRTKTVVPTFSDAAQKTVLPNARLEEIAFIEVDHLYGSISETVKPTLCFEKWTDGVYEFQVQAIDGGWLKGSVYQFWQSGDDVVGKKLFATYGDAALYPTAGCADMTSPDFVRKATFDANYYCIHDMDVLYSYRLRMTASVAGMNTTTAKGLVLDIGTNVSMTVSGGTTLPSAGQVNVDGRLIVAQAGAVGTSPVCVRKGGHLVLKNSNAVALNTPQTFTFEGGELSVSDDLSYFNKAVFKDGATVTRPSTAGELRIGAVAGTKWTVGGGSPSSCDVPFRCVSAGVGEANEFTFTWDVADVTDDADVDFFMNGDMTDFVDNGSLINGGLIMKKTGAGTLRFGGTSTCTGLVQVAEGTLLLGADNALNPGDISTRAQCKAKQPVELRGGTLAVEPGRNCVSADFRIKADSALVIGDGASFTASGMVFADGAKVAVTLGEGASFNPGAVLTRTQLNAIRFGDRPAMQNEDGTLSPRPKLGMVLFVQ